MKTIEIEDDLYAFIASQTQHIGESASDILYRLLMPAAKVAEKKQAVKTQGAAEQKAVVEKQAAPKPAVVAGDLIEELKQQGSDVKRPKVEIFVDILNRLFHRHTADFHNVLDIKGANRLYFAKDKETLLASGKSTNPKLINDAGIWVVTNNNTAKKVSILLAVMAVLGYSNQTAQQVADYFSN